VRIDELSFRRGKEIVAAKPEILASILAAIVNAQEAHLRNSRVSITTHLQREFLAEGWPQYKSKASFLNQRIAVEISYSGSKIEILTNKKIAGAVIITKAARLPVIRTILQRRAASVPIWLIGLK